MGAALFTAVIGLCPTALLIRELGMHLVEWPPLQRQLSVLTASGSGLVLLLLSGHHRGAEWR